MKGATLGLERIERNLGQVQWRGKKNIWLNTYIENPFILEQRDQRWRPSLNTKLQLLK